MGPDPAFYPSPRIATRAPAEKLAFVAIHEKISTVGNEDVLCVARQDIDLDYQ